jgi:predicted tellurium resistance membrane protein TerC
VAVTRVPAKATTGKGKAHAAFWPTVFVIEMTDIAFAVDSIVAAIGIVGQTPPDHPKDASHPKLWVIVLGGFLGVVLMRFAAVLFIRLLDRFPRFETAAYLLVVVIGLKLCVDWAGNKFLPMPAGGGHAIDFHSPHKIEFWVFWVAMIASFCVGFIPQRKPHHLAGVPSEPKG